MAVRMKTRWHRSKRSRRNIEGSSRDKTAADLGSLVAINIWKLAEETYRRMLTDEFKILSDEQQLGMFKEFIAFQIPIVDRMAYGHYDDEKRAELIQSVAKSLVENMHNNATEILGPGEHGSEFVTLLNQRMSEYAQCPFDTREGPGFGFKRILGSKISDLLATTDNKWVIEHVAEVEAPELIKQIQRLTQGTLGLPRS